MIYLLKALSRKAGSKASTERGTRAALQSPVNRSQSLHVPHCGFPTPALRQPTLLPRPPAWAPCQPGRPFLPAPHTALGGLLALSCCCPAPPRAHSSPRSPSPSSSPCSRSKRREPLPWASPPLVSTAMAFPAPERFSKNLGW